MGHASFDPDEAWRCGAEFGRHRAMADLGEILIGAAPLQGASEKRYYPLQHEVPNGRTICLTASTM